VIISRLLEKQVAVSWDELPVVVTVAPVGAEVTRADSAALLHTPAEIAADVVACAEAGASVCHVHVREEDGSLSSRRELFEEAIGLIREQTPIAALVADACELVRSLGRRPATLDEARELLACPVR
jgi:uncharacterized protein (DUF849 family)